MQNEMTLPFPDRRAVRRKMATGIPFAKMVLVGLMPGFLKKMYYRARGAKLAPGVRFGIFSCLESPHIEIGENSRIGAFTFVRARDGIKLGRRVRIQSFVAVDTGYLEIGHDSTVMEQVVVGGMLTRRSRLVVGRRVKVFPYSFLNPTEPITIEDDVGVGGANYLFTHGTWQNMLDGYPVGFGPITLKRGVWLPWRVFILPNVTVGEYATIGAGSVINRDIPAHSLAVGSPAKPIRKAEEYVKNFSPEQRHGMMLNIMKDYGDLLDYLGWKVRHEATDQSAVVALEEGDENRIVYCRDTDGLNERGKDVVISLESIPGAVRARIEAVGGSWFDIEQKQCSKEAGQIWMETRNYLSRYGIRFGVDGDD